MCTYMTGTYIYIYSENISSECQQPHTHIYDMLHALDASAGAIEYFSFRMTVEIIKEITTLKNGF